MESPWEPSTEPAPSPEPEYPTHWEAEVVLRDGATAQIRPVVPADAERLVSFYARVSDESKYFRFFAPYPELSETDVERFTHHDQVDRVALAAVVSGEFIAVVRYDRIDADGRPASAPADEAEVAFLVQDDHQGRGVASVLLEHIAACARERGIRRFSAEVLPANTKMITVFRQAGYTQHRSFEYGAVHLSFDLEPTERSVAVMRAREQRAEARSVQRLLAPGSVAVVGAGRRAGGPGRTVLRTLLDAGFTGRVYAVNHALDPGTTELAGVAARRSVREIPEPVDLAVLAVPADQLDRVLTDCGERGVQGLVVLSGSLSRTDQRRLVHRARSYGMRLIGPSALGVINADPAVRLNTTLAHGMPVHGRIGLFAQSGAIGIALLAGLRRRGAGLSTFVAAGNRADLSGNDLLQYWHDDPDTDVALLYLESFGNPRKFARLARRTAARKPVVIVKGARHSGSVPPPSHAAPGMRTPDSTVTEVLRQAGVIRVDTVTELIDVGLLLDQQPLPASSRIAILGNSESLGLLTYDACLTLGLRPRLPTDLTTTAAPDDFARACREALADADADAVVVTAIPHLQERDPRSVTALADALRSASADSGKPVVVVQLAVDGLSEALTERGIPSYPAAERAARALAEGVRYARWRREAEAPGRVPEYDDLDPLAARDLVDRALADALPGTAPEPAPSAAEARAAHEAREVQGTYQVQETYEAREVPEAPEPQEPHETHCQVETAPWSPFPGTTPLTLPEVPRTTTLSPGDAATLLGHYGIRVLPTRPTATPDDAVRAARELGFPVVLKTTAAHLRHRSDLGGVWLELGSETELRRAWAELTGTFGPAEELRLVVQAMAPRGVDTVVGAFVDPSLGPLLSFGLAGPPSELLDDTAHRLVPVTDRDAAALVRSIRTAPLLFGWRGAQPVDTAALEDLLLRLSRLVDEHPEVVRVALEPVVVGVRGVSVLSASVRLAPPPVTTDLGPRRLPDY